MLDLGFNLLDALQVEIAAFGDGACGIVRQRSRLPPGSGWRGFHLCRSEFVFIIQIRPFRAR